MNDDSAAYITRRRFAGEAEHIIDSRGLQSTRTSTLDQAQQEIDTLVNKHNNYISRPDAIAAMIARDQEP